MIRVRFAPSPTGFLHIGGARTAIFNWLYARKTGGTFILRIEDTDELRSTDESVMAIFDSLKWLELDWDEGVLWEQGASGDKEKYNKVIEKQKGNFGPYFQMQRQQVYSGYIEKLISEGKAYYCYCTTEELDKMRHDQMLMKQPPKYNGKCRDLSAGERQELEKQGRKKVVRFRMPQEGKTVVEDKIRGNVEFENKLLDDLVIVKTSGAPTYNFACVIDDHLMEITHVLRGDDHLSNTPKQIQIYNSLGWKPPEFAHLSMILGADRTKLSKRHGYTSVLEYRNQGYMPEVIFNYLILLGWSTEDSQQIFSKEEAVSKFSLEKCAKNPAVFDTQKIIWMNGEYIRKLTEEELYSRFMAYLIDTNQNDIISLVKSNEVTAKKAIKLEHEKIKLFSDIPKVIDFFLMNNIKYDEPAVEKVLRKPGAKEVLGDLLLVYGKMDDFSVSGLEAVTRKYAEEKALKTSAIFHPVRVAVSGRTVGPGLFEMLELLGKEESLKRIKYTIDVILK